MNSAILYHYKRARSHQMETYAPSIISYPTDSGGRVTVREFTGGGAAYGFHAYAALLEAKRTIRFLRNARAKHE